ncbi:hypothetical protein Adt_11938 [Abeliophyllum distichum]|uniref:Uncharacterized protein n=1 Tax=Abeliophyllum distichum TaxID=126358 RepID=A0ABD1UPB0_9LAMI
MGERRLQLEDFPHSELYNLINVCGWSKIADTPHKIYYQLVHEFYTNFNHEIDIHGTEHYGETWVRGKWFMFTPKVINDYYGITTEDIHPLSSIQDMGEVARFLYGRDDAWPLPGRDFEHSKLIDPLLILNVFEDGFGELYLHPDQHVVLPNKQEAYSHLPSLISSICVEAGIQILLAKPVLKAKGPINRYAFENARRHTRAMGAVPAPEEKPQEDHAAAPQPAAPLADIASMLRQILEGQAEHTRIIVATRTEMRMMQQELATLRASMDSFKHAQMNQESCQGNTDLEQSQIRANYDNIKSHLDRCTGQLDDIHDKICRSIPAPHQDHPVVDPATLCLPAPSDQTPGSL